MKPRTITHRTSRGAWVFGVGACLAFFNMVAAGVLNAQDGNQPGVIQEYQETWNESRESLELEGIKGAAAKLKSASEAERGEALNWLRQHTALEGRIRIGVVTPKGASPEAIWGRYVTNLESAMAEKVPSILAPRTWLKQREAQDAVRWLGEESPHPVFLPLLRQVCLNQQENYTMRYSALTSITLIPHDGMIEFLIAQLETDLAFRAWEQLNKLTKAGIHKKQEGWSDVKERYEKWWADNKEQYKYDRGRVLIEK